MSGSCAVWVTDSLHRLYPKTPPAAPGRSPLLAARGERVSFQVAAHNPGNERCVARLQLAADAALSPRVRRVGLVTLPHLNTGLDPSEIDGFEHLPGLVPDPLFDEDVLTLGPYETGAFWCNLTVPLNQAPGPLAVAAVVEVEGHTRRLPVKLTVAPAGVQPRRRLPVIQWFYADALCDWYHVAPFDDGFWRILKPYMADLVAHFEDCILVPAFTPPTDGVKRRTQLVKVRRVAPDRYEFDFSDVKRWVDLARAVGLRYFEWNHFFTQWGVRHAIRIYGEPDGELLWPPETPATSPTYRQFLAQYLPQFKAFLDREQLVGQSFFHISDEPHRDHLENYRQAREMMRELAPWMTFIDALSDLEFGRQGLVDLPVPSIQTTPEFIREGIRCATYFCCGPRGYYLNRLLETPLPKLRMAGWLFYRFQVAAFLHWGYNYWYQSQTQHLIDPYQVSDGLAWPGWAHGDTFCVYPGPQGPVDSIRWEIFGESLQDYALLETLRTPPEAPFFKAFHDFADFPRSMAWLTRTRGALLRRGAG